METQKTVAHLSYLEGGASCCAQNHRLEISMVRAKLDHD